jgi:hypothetical protein
MIQVTATCGWCLTQVTTNVKEPLPKGWKVDKVVSHDMPALVLSGGSKDTTIDENFCNEKCVANYVASAPVAHAAAAHDYTAKFYAEMNRLRGEKKKS